MLRAMSKRQAYLCIEICKDKQTPKADRGEMSHTHTHLGVIAD